MGKIVWLIIGIIGILYANENVALEQECLHCHRIQQIPDRLIYRRYLKKYSTSKRIALMMYRYLKHPEKSHSIMPPPFFLKFPMKEFILWKDDSRLQKHIHAYINKFDIKKQLILQQ